jgi:hypothetical protein
VAEEHNSLTTDTCSSSFDAGTRSSSTTPSLVGLPVHRRATSPTPHLLPQAELEVKERPVVELEVLELYGRPAAPWVSTRRWSRSSILVTSYTARPN